MRPDHGRGTTRALTTLALTVGLAAAVVAVPAVVAPQPAAAFTADQATDAFEDFLDVYWDDDARYFFTYSDHQIHPEHAHGPQGGLYTDYWWEAQLWEMVMDRYERTGDARSRALVDDVFAGFRAQYPDFRANDWNDDIGWWARGSIRAYELTGDTTYLDAAEEMFAFVAGYEDSTYGGGIWWKNVDVGDGTRNEKNVATNATAVWTAMRLHAATGDPAYRATAQRIYDWLDANFDVDGHLRDHVQGDGEYVDWDWTYNQGNFAAAALELHLGTGSPAYLADATGAVDWAIENLTSSGTFLREGVDDTGGFKAMLTRAMRSLVDEAGQTRYEQVLTDNASQAARQVNSAGIGGYDWTAPAPEPDEAAIQSLAAGATVAVLQQAVPDGATGVVVGPGVYEAENAERDGVGSESAGTGFGGRGYLAGWNAGGTSVTFHVHVAEPGPYALTLRYSAAAGTAERTLVVGGAPAPVAFAPTGAWDAWADRVVVTDLAGGHTAVTLADTSADGGGYLNLDRLTVRAAVTLAGEPGTATAGQPYSFAFALGGDPAPTVSVTAGDLPAGLALSADGVLAGVPVEPGEHAVTLTATNGSGADADLAVTLVVAAAPDGAGPGSGGPGDGGTGTGVVPGPEDGAGAAGTAGRPGIDSVPAGLAATGGEVVPVGLIAVGSLVAGTALRRLRGRGRAIRA